METVVLIVDHHHARGQLTARWLLEAGYSVTRTCDAWSGYLALRTSCPNLVLLDGGAMGLAEREVLGRFNQALADARIPVVLLGLEEGKGGPKGLGRVPVVVELSKPWVSDRLLKTVGRALCLQMARAERGLLAGRGRAHQPAA